MDAYMSPRSEKRHRTVSEEESGHGDIEIAEKVGKKQRLSDGWAKSTKSSLSSGPPRAGIMSSLFDREIRHRRMPRDFKSINPKNSINGFKYENMIELDSYQPSSEVLAVSLLKHRSKIVEFAYAEGILFVLTHSGLCSAYDCDTGKKLCMVNNQPDQLIRSLFYNRRTKSIMTVSVFRADQFTAMKCRAIPMRAIKHGKPDLGDNLFESEVLQFPGYIEFCDTNGIAVTVSCNMNEWKVWNLEDYKLRFKINNPKISDIRTSSGVLTVFYKKTGHHVPIQFFSAADGKVKRSINLLVKLGKPLEFIEQFDSKMLVKQEDTNLQILDVKTLETVEVPNSKQFKQSAFIFVDQLRLFLAFGDRNLSIYNFKGERVSHVPEHMMYYWEKFSSRYVLTSENYDLLLSYCRDSNNEGVVKFSHIPSGKTLGEIPALPDGLRMNLSAYPSNENVTAISYIDDRDTVVVGDSMGRVFLWKR